MLKQQQVQDRTPPHRPHRTVAAAARTAAAYSPLKIVHLPGTQKISKGQVVTGYILSMGRGGGGACLGFDVGVAIAVAAHPGGEADRRAVERQVAAADLVHVGVQLAQVPARAAPSAPASIMRGRGREQERESFFLARFWGRGLTPLSNHRVQCTPCSGAGMERGGGDHKAGVAEETSGRRGQLEQGLKQLIVEAGKQEQREA